MKKIVAVICSIALLMAGIPAGIILTKATAASKEVEFDESNIVLKTGVISDPHLSYSNYSLQRITERTQGYANAIAQLNEMAGGELDAVMMLGDYTSTGNKLQGETFAQATKVIFDGVFGEGNWPVLSLAYGNHDTYWKFASPEYSSMSVSEWESLFKTYALLNDGVDTDGLGSYHYKVVKGEKEFHYITLETQKYNPNEYAAETLEWLDNLLSTISSDEYVYVGSHAPIQKSGVYGTDSELEKNAAWASAGSDGLHEVLAKYPQVIYMSGHTHFSECPDTAIMQNDYTAITVSSLLAQNFYSAKSPYIDGTDSISGGMGLYIEVDGNGNQRISRVDFAGSETVADIVVDAEKSADLSAENPAYGLAGEPEYISSLALSSCSVKTKGTASVYGDVWKLPKPDAEKSQLNYYTKERDEQPAFAESSAVTVSDSLFDEANKTLKATVEFPQTENKTLHYRIAFLDENGGLLKEYWALGNWCPTTAGVSESGKTHLNASSLKYTVQDIPAAAQVFSVRVTPVSEYGSLGNAIVSGTVTAETAVSKPAYSNDRVNYIDSMYGAFSAAVANKSASSTYGKVDTISFSGKTNSSTKTVNLFLDAFKAKGLTEAQLQDNKAGGLRGDKMTSFSADDITVFEADYAVSDTNVSNNSYLLFNVRQSAAENTNNVWNNGIKISAQSQNVAVIKSANENKNEFVYTAANPVTLKAGAANHITVVSCKDKVYVWIDDICVMNGVAYKDGENDMIPVLSITGCNVDATVSNIKYYLYNGNDGTPEIGATNKNYLDGGILIGGWGYATSKTTSITSTAQLVAYTNADNAVIRSEGRYETQANVLHANVEKMSDFAAEDEIVFDTKYTAANGTDSLKYYFATFKNGTNAYRLEFTSNSIALCRTGNGNYNFTLNNVTDIFDGESHRITAKWNNECISLWIDGILYINNFAYYDYGNFDVDKSDLLHGFYIDGGAGTYTDTKIFKLQDQSELSGVKVINGYTDNMLNSAASDLYSNYRNGAVSNDWYYKNGILYSNMTAGGSFGEKNYLFGSKNGSSPIDDGDGYAISAVFDIKEFASDNAGRSVGAGFWLGDDVKITVNPNHNALYYNGTANSIDLSNYLNAANGKFRLTAAVKPGEYTVYLNGFKMFTHQVDEIVYLPAVLMNSTAAYVSDISVRFNQQYYADTLNSAIVTAEAKCSDAEARPLAYNPSGLEALKNAVDSARAVYNSNNACESDDTRINCKAELSKLLTAVSGLQEIIWDINNDSVCSADDISAMRTMLLNGNAVDVNRDGEINICDLVCLNDYLNAGY